MEVQAFRSKTVVLAIKVNGSRHKILQILWGNDGSLYVTFPYFDHSEGILAIVTFPPTQAVSSLSLEEAGKVSSHLVKYAHHQSGQAHFSQDGKIKTEIKKPSVALAKQQGHIFTVLVKGMKSFKTAHEHKDSGTSPKRTTINFEIPQAGADSFRIVGRWYWIEDLEAEPRPPVVGPIIRTRRRQDGVEQDAFIVASPNQDTRHVLLLTCEVDERITDEPKALAFYGGFDPPDVVNDYTKPSKFLAFIYPVTDAETLRARIGSVDFSRPSG